MTGEDDREKPEFDLRALSGIQQDASLSAVGPLEDPEHVVKEPFVFRNNQGEPVASAVTAYASGASFDDARGQAAPRYS